MALVFTCPCLNVQITVENGVVLETRDNDNFHSLSSDNFFQNAERVEAPKGATIKKQLECLCQARQVESWSIMKCINCNVETQAISCEPQNLSVLFISTMMESNPTISKLLHKSKEYSQVYKIMIKPPPTGSQFVGKPICSLSNDPQGRLEELKLKVTQSLDEEREVMLERIRIFENEQNINFNKLQSKAWQDHHALSWNLITNCNIKNNSNGSTVNQKEVLNNSEDHTKSDSLEIAAEIRPSLRQVSNRGSPQKSQLMSKSHPDTDDIMFPMDEENDDAVFESSDDDSPVEEKEIAFDVGDSLKLFATSLPISMPGAWQPELQSHDLIDEETDNVVTKNRKQGDDPQWIAASIQALAMSVRGTDGTEMFGARPRPRLNTLD